MIIYLLSFKELPYNNFRNYPINLKWYLLEQKHEVTNEQTFGNQAILIKKEPYASARLPIV
jgi:hypothetical protein